MPLGEKKTDIVRELMQLKDCIDRTLRDKTVMNTYAMVKTVVLECLQRGGKILFVGNGGSAAECQHIAAEFVGRFSIERVALPAIALTTDSSILTSISNDYSYEEVFERQVLALGNKHDILIALTTSGNSENVVRACKIAKRRELTTIGLTGQKQGKVGRYCDLHIAVPSAIPARVQELHLTLLHALCSEVDAAYAS